MAIIEDLVASVEHVGAEVHEVVTGPCWTLVVTSGGGTAASGGLAARLPAADIASGISADSYRGSPAARVLRLALSANPLEASIGVATLNALIAGRLDTSRLRPGTIPRATGKRVVVAGDFPFTDNLRSIAEDLKVIEPSAGSDEYPGAEAARLIGAADITLIAGRALLDGTLEPLLKLARSCFTIVYGPSTALSPILFGYGADQLVGVRIADPEAVKSHILGGQGEIMRCPGLDPIVLARPQSGA